MVMCKVGQIVYCTKSAWVNGNNISLFNPPKKGDMMIITGTKTHKGRLLLAFRNQPKSIYYPAKHFRPQHCLFADEVLEKLTKEKV